jgi:hypothetical protein
MDRFSISESYPSRIFGDSTFSPGEVVAIRRSRVRRSLNGDIVVGAGDELVRGRTQPAAVVGVAENGNSAVLVTVTPGGELLDRRQIDLTEPGLPTHPHHHEGSYDRERVFRDAATALGREEIDAFLQAMGRAVGPPPWQAKHKLAAAAALAAT